MKEKTITTLRWIAVLPGAIASYILGNIITIGIFWVVSQLDSLSVISKLLSKEIAGGIAAYCFMEAGIQIVPNRKKITALILLIIFTLIMALPLLSNIKNKEYEDIITAAIEIVIALLVFLFTKGEKDELHIDIK